MLNVMGKLLISFLPNDQNTFTISLCNLFVFFSFRAHGWYKLLQKFLNEKQLYDWFDRDPSAFCKVLLQRNIWI